MESRTTAITLVSALLIVGVLGWGGAAVEDVEASTFSVGQENSQLSPSGDAPAVNGATGEPVAQAENGSAESNGLLPAWDDNYDGQCTDCHIPGGERAAFHPTQREGVDTSSWFYDDDNQQGPNLQLSNFQEAGIQVQGETVTCSQCHTVSSPSNIEDPSTVDATGDPHSVHDGVVNREGCARCHGAQATSATNGVNAVINMSRKFDDKLLSTQSEAPFGGVDKSTEGSGWAEYMSSESPEVTTGSCGDCHGQFHADSALRFSFDTESRAGPMAYASGDAGIQLGEGSLKCGSCHADNVHAVHNNGETNPDVSYAEATDMSTEWDTEGVSGAESCLECHGSAIASEGGGHWKSDVSEQLGLVGPRDGLPDASVSASEEGDCGFCHQGSNNGE